MSRDRTLAMCHQSRLIMLGERAGAAPASRGGCQVAASREHRAHARGRGARRSGAEEENRGAPGLHHVPVHEVVDGDPGDPPLAEAVQASQRRPRNLAERLVGEEALVAAQDDPVGREHAREDGVSVPVVGEAPGRMVPEENGRLEGSHSIAGGRGGAGKSRGEGRGRERPH